MIKDQTWETKDFRVEIIVRSTSYDGNSFMSSNKEFVETATSAAARNLAHHLQSGTLVIASRSDEPGDKVEFRGLGKLEQL